MADSVALSKGMCDIARRGMAIRMNTLSPDYGVERFKSFGRKKDGRPKPTNVSWKVYEYVEFWFVEPAVRPASGT